MTKYLSGLVILGVVSLTHLTAQTLQDFSAVVGPNTYFYGNWEATGQQGLNTPNSQFVQNVGSYTITGTGVTNSSDSILEFYYSSFLTIGTNGFLAVRAQALELNAATSFQVSLIDSSNNVAFAAFTADGFAGGGFVTVTKSLNTLGGFNPNAIEFIQISGNQPSGNAAFKFAFDNIEATGAPIPEPSTWAFGAGIAVVGYSVCRRRRASVKLPVAA